MPSLEGSRSRREQPKARITVRETALLRDRRQQSEILLLHPASGNDVFPGERFADEDHGAQGQSIQDCPLIDVLAAHENGGTLGMAAEGLPEDLRATPPGHHHVQKKGVVRLALHPLERISVVRAGVPFPTQLHQGVRQRLGEGGIVVDHQHAWLTLQRRAGLDLARPGLAIGLLGGLEESLRAALHFPVDGGDADRHRFRSAVFSREKQAPGRAYRLLKVAPGQYDREEARAIPAYCVVEPGALPETGHVQGQGSIRPTLRRTRERQGKKAPQTTHSRDLSFKPCQQTSLREC